MDMELIPIDGLLMDMGLEDIPEEQKLKLQENFTRFVEEKTMAVVLESLDEEQKKQLDALANDEERSDFLKENGIDIDDILLFVLEGAKIELVREAAYAQGYIDGKSEQDAA